MKENRLSGLPGQAMIVITCGRSVLRANRRGDLALWRLDADGHEVRC